MPINQNVIDAEIKLRIPGYAVKANYAQLALEVGSYLSDCSQMITELKLLEQEMQDEATNRLGGPLNVAASQNAFVNRTPGVKLPDHLQNLLTTVLARAESQHGFYLGVAQNSTGAQRPAALLLTGFIDENEFRSLLRQQMPFKDPTVPFGHGEFSHRIQWYCLIKRAQAFTTQGTALADLYEWVGTQAHTQTQNGDQAGWANQGLWDALFDRNKYQRDNVNGPYNTASLTDFRSPENLHEHLTTDANMKADCPLLSTFLEVREAKRANTTMNAAYINDYVTKKVFGAGVTYAQLSNHDRAQIDAVVAGKTLLPQPTQQQTSDTVMQKLSALFRALWW
jgi:hypothetical protein